MEFKEYLGKLKLRLSELENLFSVKELTVSYDVLASKSKTDNELLYFNTDGKEITGIFIFGHSFFVHELNEQDFKRTLGQNSLNLKIYNAYKKLRRKQRRVKISDIINCLHDKKKDSREIHITLRRILTLAYYLNWNLEKDKKDIESDFYIEIPDKFLLSLKRRFNFDIVSPVYENSDFFVFLNARGKLNLVFKEMDDFTKSDVEKHMNVLKKVFKIKKINFKK